MTLLLFWPKFWNKLNWESEIKRNLLRDQSGINTGNLLKIFFYFVEGSINHVHIISQWMKWFLSHWKFYDTIKSQDLFRFRRKSSTIPVGCVWKRNSCYSLRLQNILQNYSTHCNDGKGSHILCIDQPNLKNSNWKTNEIKYPTNRNSYSRI